MILLDRLLAEVARIPKGEVRTYKELALAIGTGPRVVAKLISQNPHPIVTPCHRVIRSDGSVGGYTYKGRFDPEKKIELLRKEGHTIVNGKIVTS